MASYPVGVTRLAALFPLVALLTSGCAARAGFVLLDAERSYRDAVDAEAEERAPYEFTLAHEYLQKAKEEDGYSDYSAVEQLCRASKQASIKAVKESQERGVKIKNTTALPESLEDKDTSTEKPPVEDEGDDN